MRIVAPPSIHPLHTPEIEPTKSAPLHEQARRLPPLENTRAKQAVAADTARFVRGATEEQRSQFFRANMLQSLAGKLGDLSQQLTGALDQHLDSAARALRKQLQSQKPSLSMVMNLAGDDSAEAYGMLQAAAKQANKEGATGELVAIAQHMNLLRKTFRKSSFTNTQSARIIARSKLDPRRRSTLRPIYSDTVEGQANIAWLVEQLMSEQKEPGQFEVSLREARSAISDDMSALLPTTSRQPLRTLMHGQSTALHVASLLRGCTDLLKRMNGKNPDLKVNPPAFLKHLLALSGRGMMLKETLELTQHIGGNQLSHQLVFLNELLRTLNLMPYPIWRDPKSRTTAMSNLRILMTELTQQEQTQMNVA